jgi:4-hydroxy-3-methylbut-2-enyl diphosphate reductase
VKKLLLAQPRGFCFGVENALKIVTKALKKHKKPLYVFNEIVHNKTIVEQLEKKGVVFTQKIQDIPKQATVIISAHGISPETILKFQKKELNILDATCPLVQKVHKEASYYTENGYHIIYIGNKHHEEAIGVLGETNKNVSIVEKEADITRIKPGQQRYVVLTQTTLNIFETEKMFQKIKQAFPFVEFPDHKDLCRATTERQQAVQQLAARCDTFLIIGSQNSSNAQKLKEIAAAFCPAYLIDSPRDIRPEWLKDINVLGLSSGASTPEDIVEDTISFLIQEHDFQL